MPLMRLSNVDLPEPLRPMTASHFTIGEFGIGMLENTMLPRAFAEAAAQILNAQHRHCSS